MRERTSLAKVLTVALGVAAVVALLSASQAYSARVAEGLPANWWHSFRTDALERIAWAVLVPGVFALAWHLPLGSTPRRRFVAIWASAAILFLGAHTLIEVSVARPMGWVPTSMSYGLMWFARGSSTAAVNLIVFALVAFIAYAVEHQRERAARERRVAALSAELDHARLQVLQMQLQPHFLFNALHAVSALMATDVAGARTMLAALGDLLRASLEQMDVQEVSLREELDFLGRYLDIQRTRFRDRLVVRVDAAPGTLDARVPTLLLQPLVENAIRHTVERRSDAGSVEVSASRAGNELIVDVRDNGPGFGATGRTSGGGVGLANTRRRLEQLYGDQQRLELADADTGGAIVRVVVPFRTGDSS